jgi:hypothetical protein
MRRIKTTITVKRERLLLITPRRGRIEGWCGRCAAQVILMGIAEAAVIANVTQRTLFRRIEAGDLHFAETGEGAVLVCLNSLKTAPA